MVCALNGGFDMTRKAKNKVTFELLRKDAVFAADLLLAEVNRLATKGGLTRQELAVCDSVARALKHATHVVVYDADQLPED